MNYKHTDSVVLKSPASKHVQLYMYIYGQEVLKWSNNIIPNPLEMDACVIRCFDWSVSVC